MFYLNKCLKKIITHWSKTAWVTKIYQTFQPTAEELKPSEKWNTLLPRHQTGAILYHKAWFTLKIIDTNSLSTTVPVFINQSWTRSTNSASQCHAWAGSCQPKHKPGLNDYCSNQNWTPAVLTKLCQTQTCSKPKLLWILEIRKDFYTLRTGKQWSSLSKASTVSMLGHFRDQTEQYPKYHGLTSQQILLGAGNWTRSSSKVPSKLNYPMNHSWVLSSHTHTGTGLTLLSWVTWFFHSWDISFLKHLTPQ